MARRVTAPDGTKWKVGRDWLPWRVRLRRDTPDFDMPDAFGLDDLPGIFAVVALVLLLIVAVVLGWFLIALAIELVVLLVGFLVGVLGRTVLRKPWIVRARSERGEHTWRVRGWGDSGTRVDVVAGALERGLPLPDADT